MTDITTIREDETRNGVSEIAPLLSRPESELSIIEINDVLHIFKNPELRAILSYNSEDLVKKQSAISEIEKIIKYKVLNEYDKKYQKEVRIYYDDRIKEIESKLSQLEGKDGKGNQENSENISEIKKLENELDRLEQEKENYFNQYYRQPLFEETGIIIDNKLSEEDLEKIFEKGEYDLKKCFLTALRVKRDILSKEIEGDYQKFCKDCRDKGDKTILNKT